MVGEAAEAASSKTQSAQMTTTPIAIPRIDQTAGSEGGRARRGRRHPPRVMRLTPV
jgi:hypothetical protein